MAEQGNLWVVLTAAGSGTRLGADVPKALVEVQGSTLLALALEQIAGASGVQGVVVTAPAGMEDRFEKETPASLAGRVRVVAGGASRQASVKAGLDEARSWMEEKGLDKKASDAEIVLVHDAARALAPPSLMNRLVAALGLPLEPAPVAVIPGLPVTDTIKQVVPVVGWANDAEGTSGGQADDRAPKNNRAPEDNREDETARLGPVDRVTTTPERSSLRAVQTPQAFRMGPLYAAHVKHASLGGDEGVSATDDATLLEWEGKTVLSIEGDEKAFKVTNPPDLERAAEVILGA